MGSSGSVISHAGGSCHCDNTNKPKHYLDCPWSCSASALAKDKAGEQGSSVFYPHDEQSEVSVKMVSIECVLSFIYSEDFLICHDPCEAGAPN